MDVMDCGRFQFSGFGNTDFETTETTIREIVYLFYNNFQKAWNAIN